MSLTRSMERKIIRNRAEAEAVLQRAMLRTKRKKPTDALPIERNVILFKRAWDAYHYSRIEVKDKDGNINVIKKRKPVKKKRYLLGSKPSVDHMLKKKIAERFRKSKEKYKNKFKKKSEKE